MRVGGVKKRMMVKTLTEELNRGDGREGRGFWNFLFDH